MVLDWLLNSSFSLELIYFATSSKSLHFNFFCHTLDIFSLDYIPRIDLEYSWLPNWLSISIEPRCHLHWMHQLCVCLSWQSCESGEAGAGSRAARVTRSWLRYALSRAGERFCSAKIPPRSGLPASAICTQPNGGSNRGEQKGGGGGRREPKQACPTTHSGRKQSSVGSVSAQETSCGKVREWRWEAY